MLIFCSPLFAVVLLAQAAPPEPAGSGVVTYQPWWREAAGSRPAREPQAREVIAYLGRTPLRFGDFIAWLSAMAGPQAKEIIKQPTAQKRALRQYLDLKLLAAKGQQEKLQDTQEFKTLMVALRLQAYARVLVDEDRAGGDGQRLKAQAESPSEQEVQAYFDANAERYVAPEAFTARSILVRLQGAPGAVGQGVTEAEALDRLAKAREELEAGRNWEEVARNFSDDPRSKDNGGLYLDYPFGRLDKEFDAAVRVQEIGKLSEPVKTSGGIWLIQVEAIRPRQPGDFNKIKNTIRKQMIPERWEQATRTYLEEARKQVGFREVANPSAESPGKPATVPAAKSAADAAPAP